MVMGVRKIELVDFNFRQTMMDAVPEIRIEGKDELKWSKRKKKKERFLLGLVMKSLLGTNRHKNRGHLQDSFTCEKLTRGLGRYYKKYMTPLYEFSEGNRDYSCTDHYTKAYKLRPEVRGRARSALRKYDGSGTVVDEKGNPIFKYRRPKNGNKCRKSEIKVPALIPIDLDTLNRTIESLEAIDPKEGASGNAKPSVTEDIDRLCDSRRWVRVTGGVPNFYQDQTTGRLGRLGQFHIIGMSKTQRMLLMRTKDWYDFDFKNCHYAIFRSLCSHHGFQTPCIDDYLDDHRDRLADLLWPTCQIPHAATKKTFLSFLNGAPFAPHHSNTATRNLGYSVVEILKEDPWSGNFIEEIRKGRDLILDEFPRVQGVTTNVVGKGTTASKKKSRLSHVLVGYERWALETVCRDFPDTQCLIYDGWISPDRDVKKLEESIVDRSMTEFGFPMELKIKKEKIPDSVAAIL